MRRGYDDELVKDAVEVPGVAGPPLRLGQYALLAKRGDRFLDPSGNVQTFAGRDANGDPQVYEEDRIHKRVRRDERGRPVKDAEGRTIVDVRVTLAVWSSWVIVRPVPRDYLPRERPGVREVRSVAYGGQEV